jgi:hypothetical protein
MLSNKLEGITRFAAFLALIWTSWAGLAGGIGAVSQFREFRTVDTRLDHLWKVPFVARSKGILVGNQDRHVQGKIVAEESSDLVSPERNGNRHSVAISGSDPFLFGVQELFPVCSSFDIQCRNDAGDLQWAARAIHDGKAKMRWNRIRLGDKVPLPPPRIYWEGIGNKRQREQFHPLVEFGLLDGDAGARCTSGITCFPRLPADYNKGDKDNPNGNAFGPCQEFVSTWHATVGFLFLILSIAGMGYLLPRCGRGVALFWALACVWLAGCLILTGHQYYCPGKSHRDSEQHSGSFQHGGTLPQSEARGAV